MTLPAEHPDFFWAGIDRLLANRLDIDTAIESALADDLPALLMLRETNDQAIEDWLDANAQAGHG